MNDLLIKIYQNELPESHLTGCVWEAVNEFLAFRKDVYYSLMVLASLSYVFFDQAYPQLKQQIKQNSRLYLIQSILTEEYERNIEKLRDQSKTNLSFQEYKDVQNKLRILDPLLRLLFTDEKEEEKIKKLYQAVQDEHEKLKKGNLLTIGFFVMFKKRQWQVIETTLEKLRDLTLSMSRKSFKTMKIKSQEDH